jgi:arylsulfatase A-like enzyme
MRRALAALCAFSWLGCGGPTLDAPGQPPVSVLLVTIDTLRADRLGCYGDQKARTPALDAFAGAATLFEAAFTPVPITLPAHTSILTGLLPPAHGVRGNVGFALAADVPTLAESLKRRGLQTAAFIGGFPLTRRFGLARGFDVYDDAVVKPGGVNFDLAERRADDVANAALGWLAGRKGPVFLWVHFFDPHAPYDPPPAFRTGDPYRDEIASVDAALGRVLRAWDARAGSSLAIVTSDHGEAFGEHGEWSHSLLLYDTTLHVPLLVRGDGFPAGRRVGREVSIADLARTAAEAAGASPLPGASLREALASGAPRGLYAETLAPQLDFGWAELRSWREAGLKYVRAPRPELYDLSADPAESRDVSRARPEPLRRLARALDASLAAMGERRSRKPLDPEAAERLRALGYLQGPGGAGSGADPKDKLELARRIAAAAGPFDSYERAASAYRALLPLDPQNPLLNFRLAHVLLRSGKAQESLSFFGRVVSGSPRTAEAHVGLATALAQLGRLAEAEAVLEAGLRIDSGNAQIHYNLGEIARVRGDKDAARRHYERALGDLTTGVSARARLEELR